MFSLVRRRNNYYYSRKGQILRAKSRSALPRSLTISDIHEMAKITNSQGITIPNPNPPKPHWPDPPTPEPEEEESAPQPPPDPTPEIIHYVDSILGTQNIAIDKKFNFQLSFNTSSIEKLRNPVTPHETFTAAWTIYSPDSLFYPLIFIAIEDKYDFKTGNGDFTFTIIKPINVSGTETPPSEAFPLSHTQTGHWSRTIGYIIGPDHSNLDHLQNDALPQDSISITFNATDELGEHEKSWQSYMYDVSSLKELEWNGNDNKPYKLSCIYITPATSDGWLNFFDKEQSKGISFYYE